MTFRALVQASIKHIRDPDDPCNLTLFHTLKKEITNDLTEAFVQSRPLIDKYSSLYNESKSFLDFLCSLCDVNTPKITITNVNPFDSNFESLHSEIERLKNEILKLQSEKMQCNKALVDIRDKLKESDQNLKNCQDKLIKNDKEFEHENSSLQLKVKSLNSELFKLKKENSQLKLDLEDCMKNFNKENLISLDISDDSNNCLLQSIPDQQSQTTVKQLDTEFDELKKKNGELEFLNITLEKQNTDLIIEIEQILKEKNDISNQYETLKENLQEYSDKTENLKMNNDECLKMLKICNDQTELCVSNMDKILDMVKDYKICQENLITTKEDSERLHKYLEEISNMSIKTEKLFVDYIEELNDKNSKQFDEMCQLQSDNQTAIQDKLTAVESFLNNQIVKVDDKSAINNLSTHTEKLSEFLQHLIQMKETFDTLRKFENYDFHTLQMLLQSVESYLKKFENVAALQIEPSAEVFVEETPPMITDSPISENVSTLGQQMLEFKNDIQLYIQNLTQKTEDGIKSEINKSLQSLKFDNQETITTLSNLPTISKNLLQLQNDMSEWKIQVSKQIETFTHEAKDVISSKIDESFQSFNQLGLKAIEYENREMLMPPPTFTENLSKIEREISQLKTNVEKEIQNFTKETEKTIKNKLNQSTTNFNQSTSIITPIKKNLSDLGQEVKNMEQEFKAQIKSFIIKTEKTIKSQLNSSINNLMKWNSENIATKLKEMKDSVDKSIEWYTNSNIAVQWVEVTNALKELVPAIQTIEKNYLQIPDSQNNYVTLLHNVEKIVHAVENKPTQDKEMKDVSLLKEHQSDELGIVEKESFKSNKSSCDCKKLRNFFENTVLNEMMGDNFFEIVTTKWRDMENEVLIFNSNLIVLQLFLKEHGINYELDKNNFHEHVKNILYDLHSKIIITDVSYNDEIIELKRIARRVTDSNEEFFNYIKFLVENDTKLINRRARIFKKREMQPILKTKTIKNKIDIKKPQCSKQNEILRKENRLFKAQFTELYSTYNFEKPKKLNVKDFIEKINKVLSEFENLKVECNKISQDFELTSNSQNGWNGFYENVKNYIKEKIKIKRKLSDNSDEIKSKVVLKENFPINNRNLVQIKNLIFAIYVKYFQLLLDFKYRQIPINEKDILKHVTAKLIILAQMKESDKPQSFYYKMLKDYVQCDLNLYNGHETYLFAYKTNNDDNDVEKILEECFAKTKDMMQKFFS